ncbi:MAG: hypothetical protein JWN23_1323 [Rhodocyclales bacterium]|nr:hypothetical protein [Rhodocyclales bacterium]
MENKTKLLSIVAILAFLTAGPVQAMTIEVHGNTVYATGPVVDDYPKFKEALASPAIERVVFVNSTGGDLWAGMQVGKLIKEKGVNTVIAGYCISACSIMFMGGKERSFSDAFRPAQTYIGIHGAHDIYSMALVPEKGAEIIYFMKQSMAEHFNAKVMDMALYKMDDAGALLKVFDAKRLPRRLAYHCASSKILRKDCTDIPDQDALTLGIVTTNDFATVDLPAGFRTAPNIAGRELNQSIADADEYFKDLDATQCSADRCRRLIAGYANSNENKALAVPIGAAGFGIVGNRESETNAFLGAIYACNHVKNALPRLCETQIVNGFDVRNLYASAVASHGEALAKLIAPSEQYYGDEQYGGGLTRAHGLRTEDLGDTPPQDLDEIKKFSTRELAVALKRAQAPVLIDVINLDDVIPTALSLLYGGFAFADTVKDSAYEARFAGLLKLLSPDKNQAIIFYSKKRDWSSANAAMRAKRIGYSQVGWYRGGLESWKAADLPVASPVVRAVVQ